MCFTNSNFLMSWSSSKHPFNEKNIYVSTLTYVLIPLLALYRRQFLQKSLPYIHKLQKGEVLRS